ncbi:MAG TPA: LysR family transcriptional regulator, partial [Aliiroseovarius sp.]|nr:LysR family transcriptional regulator [Aliiroseovarius sp.]
GQKITDYHLHFAAAREYLAQHGWPAQPEDLKRHPLVGYIQDMIFYPELDFLSELGLERVELASNLVAVQLGFLRAGGGIGITHDFILPFAPELTRVLADALSFTRSFYLVRHEADARVERLALVAEQLVAGIRREVARLEAAG